MRSARRVLLGEAIQIALAFVGAVLAVVMLQGCTPSQVPDAGPIVEAGAGVANGVCSILEGVTDNQTVISVCATVEEVATIAAWILTFVRADTTDAGACTSLTTNVCATRAEIGRGIQLVLAKRRAILFVDAGAP